MVPVQLTAVLTDPVGNPVPGETYQFFYKLSTDPAYASGGSAVTDATGTATVTLSLMAPDIYDFRAVFSGDSAFDASQASIVFDTVSQDQTQISVSASTTVGTNVFDVNINGSISANGAPIAGAVLSVALDGMTMGQTNASDSAGAFTFQIIGVPFGAHTITVSFAGDQTHLASQSSATVSVGGGGGILAPLIVAGAAALLGLGLYVTRRKKR